MRVELEMGQERESGRVNVFKRSSKRIITIGSVYIQVITSNNMFVGDQHRFNVSAEVLL